MDENDVLRKKATEYGVNLDPLQEEVTRLIRNQNLAEKNQRAYEEQKMVERIKAEKAARERAIEKERLDALHAKSAKQMAVWKEMYRANWIANGGNEYGFLQAWPGIEQSIILGVINPAAEITAKKRKSMDYNLL